MNTDQIIEELREKQKRKRQALDELELAIANLEIPKYVSPHPEPRMKLVEKTVLSDLGGSVSEFLSKLKTVCNSFGCTPEDLKFKVTDNCWDNQTVNVILKINRPETLSEIEERIAREKDEHDDAWERNNQAKLKKYEITRNRLIRNIASLVNAEKTLTGDTEQAIRDRALCKLSETERSVLGLI